MAHVDESEKRTSTPRLRLDSQIVAQMSSARSLSQGLGMEAESTPTSPACCTPPTLMNELHDND